MAGDEARGGSRLRSMSSGMRLWNLPRRSRNWLVHNLKDDETTGRQLGSWVAIEVEGAPNFGFNC